MRALARVAEEAGVILLHENEKEIYGDIPERCLDIVTVGRLAATSSWPGIRPTSSRSASGRSPRGTPCCGPTWSTSRSRTPCSADGSVVVAGAGDGEVVETIRALRDDGFDGFFSLEPHLEHGHALGGFSGPELFPTRLARPSPTILKTEEITYA